MSEAKTPTKRRKVKQISQLEHAKRKSMWTGSKKLQSVNMYLVDRDAMIQKKIKFTPTFYKIVDEVVVNAIDHWVNFPKKVKNIIIKFDIETGHISVTNDGPGIEIELTENIGGKSMYSVQLIASEFLAGDNLDEDEERKTGGTNGAGLKLTNAFSDELVIHTTDEESKQYYYQVFQNRLETILPPTITKISSKKTPENRRKGHTEVSFLPSYEVMGYEGGYNKKRDGKDIDLLIKTRALQAAVYTKCSVYYNGDLIEIPNIQTTIKKNAELDKFKGFCQMFLNGDQKSSKSAKSKSAKSKSAKSKSKESKSDSDSEEDSEDQNSEDQNSEDDQEENPLFGTTIKGTDKKHIWHVCLGLSSGKFQQVSIINGIWVHKGGSHITHLQTQIVNYLKPRVEKAIKKTKAKFNPNYILNNLFLFMKGSINNPDFTSQIKDCLDDPIEKFDEYKFSAKDLTAMWIMLEPAIMSMFFEKKGDKKKTRVSRGSVNVPKCTDAKFAGHKTKAKECVMIICEGDSARGTVHEGIVNKKTTLTYAYFGTYNINGVPMNARKECTIYEDKQTKTTRLIRSTRLQNNERLTSLVKVLGLDYEKTYDIKTVEGKKEIESLRYGGGVVGAMDQDEDGKGNIFGLIVNFFERFWPCLVEQRYIKRLNTPIVRLYPKSKKKYVEEFMSLKQMTDWVEEKYDGDEEKMVKDYNIKYFKGLGSHKKAEVPHMFKNFNEILYTYYLDALGKTKLNVYFGTNTDLRKIELATPVSLEPSEGTDIPISEQLMIDTKSYQRDNIIRKVPSLVDGQVPSRRKVIAAGRAVFGQTNASNREMKVNAFVNETSRKMHYHHGEQSLAVTVTRMAQDFPGARSYPFLRPEGQFGTRSNGGKDFASPRYTFTKLNQRLCFQMFPICDDFLLEYVIDDGERCEPKFYIPIIPLAIMENMELPATGWKVKLWARDPFEIIENVRKLLQKKITLAKEMSLFQHKNKSTIKTYKNRKYSVGKCTVKESTNEVIITELPLGMYSSQVIGDPDKPTSLINRDYLAEQPSDETNDDGVRITLTFKEGEIANIKSKYGNETFTCWEDHLNLKTSLDENINMIDENEKVIEFKKYEHVVDKWFVLRKKLYAERIDREIVLIELKMRYLKNVIRFTKHHQKYQISPKTKRDKVDEILAKEKYDTFNHTLLLNPKYTKVSEMRGLIMNSPIPGNTTYVYIVNLRYSEMIEDACKRRQTELDNLEKKLAILKLDLGENEKNGGLPKGGKTWMSELDDLETTIKLGLSAGWDYGENAAKFR